MFTRRMLAFVGLVGLFLFAVPAADAHIVKIDGDQCGGHWVDDDPTDNDLTGYDPSAVVVLHWGCYMDGECIWISTILGCSHQDPIP